MPTIHIRHTRKLILVFKESVGFYLHLVNDLDLHSVENMTMTQLENTPLEVTSTI